MAAEVRNNREQSWNELAIDDPVVGAAEYRVASPLHLFDEFRDGVESQQS